MATVATRHVLAEVRRVHQRWVDKKKKTGRAPLRRRNAHALPVRAQGGVDQGCPLCPGLFAIGIADALSRADARLTHLHPSARIFSYLDDVVAVVPANLAALAGAMPHPTQLKSPKQQV